MHLSCHHRPAKRRRPDRSPRLRSNRGASSRSKPRSGCEIPRFEQLTPVNAGSCGLFLAGERRPRPGKSRSVSSEWDIRKDDGRIAARPGDSAVLAERFRVRRGHQQLYPAAPVTDVTLRDSPTSDRRTRSGDRSPLVGRPFTIGGRTGDVDEDTRTEWSSVVHRSRLTLPVRRRPAPMGTSRSHGVFRHRSAARATETTEG